MITAYRCWSVTFDGHLSAASGRTTWNPGANEAQHWQLEWQDINFDFGRYVYTLQQRHPVPDDRCDCGFWAVHDLHLLRAYLLDMQLADRPIIFGTVGLWGKVVEHELGYRGQYAIVSGLYKEPAHSGFNTDVNVRITAASRRYEVPILKIPGEQE